ncbi:MAG: 1-phosphofructokinase family hexose kinase [Spirochaetota bacterium]
MHVLVVCLNPTVQRTYVVEDLRIGEVNRVKEHRVDASGKGVNAARVLAALGAEARHLTHSGGREDELFVELAEADGVRMETVSADIELRVANTIVDQRNHTTTEVVEEGRVVTAEVEHRVWRRYTELLREVDAVHIAGSKAPGFSGDLFPSMVARAREEDRFVLLDYRGDDLVASLRHAPQVVKPNFVEFVHTFLPERSEVARSEHTQEPSLVSAVCEEMLRIHRQFRTDVVLTRGSRPTFFTENGRVREEPVPAIAPVNTIGSGDAFGAGFLYKRLSGATMREAVAFAHTCATDNAGLLKPGAIGTPARNPAE